MAKSCVAKVIRCGSSIGPLASQFKWAVMARGILTWRCDEENAWLVRERKVSFEQIPQISDAGDYLDITKDPLPSIQR
jgi:hypothetical protein